jgi:hypothetical protein
MINFFLRLIKAWREAGIRTRYEWTPDTETDWDNEIDGMRLLEFMRSSTGLKLKRELSNYSLTTALNAVQNQSNATWHCGFAAGVKMCVETFQNLIFDPQTVAKMSATRETSETDVPTVPVLR